MFTLIFTIQVPPADQDQCIFITQSFKGLENRKNMKKLIYALVLLLVVVSGLVLYSTESKAEPEKWEATPDGIRFKNWKASPEGRKVLAAADKISNQVKASANMEAVVTSLSLPPGSRVGFGVMVRINGEDYILSFGLLKANEYQQLHSLNVNDKIVLRSHSVMYAPKYAYPILSGDYVGRDSIVIYKAVPHKGGC
jgi:hypothetical protein